MMRWKPCHCCVSGARVERFFFWEVNFGLTLPCGIQASRASVTRMAGRCPVLEGVAKIILTTEYTEYTEWRGVCFVLGIMAWWAMEKWSGNLSQILSFRRIRMGAVRPRLMSVRLICMDRFWRIVVYRIKRKTEVGWNEQWVPKNTILHIPSVKRLSIS